MVSVSRELLGRDRAPFLPDVIWYGVEGGDGFTRDVRIDRCEDPQAWQTVADGDDFIVTQWDDGTSDGPGMLPLATSSASMPTVVKQMLDACDVHEGQHVLEIGTGTGYTAALLSDRVGPTGRVVTVEVDPELAAAARTRLEAAGVDVEVVCADGLQGWEPGAPYDRVHVTCGIRRIPSAWLEQCPAGLIALPWGTSISDSRDRLLTLSVADGVGVGRLGTGIAFMKARSQRAVPFPWDAWPDTDDAAEADLHLAWDEIEGSLNRAGEFVMGLLVSGLTFRLSGSHDAGDGRVLWLERDGAYASIGFGKERSTTLTGDRSLIGDYARAVRWWYEQGCPEAHEFGLRVAGDGEYTRSQVWFGSPDTIATP